MGNLLLGLLWFLLVAVSIFMMLLILIQRGRGGGLTGALGGAGGQSAFGSKAGDVFTRITIVTAIVWITLSMVTISLYNRPPRVVKVTPPGITGTGGAVDQTESNGAATGGTGEAKDSDGAGAGTGTETDKAPLSNDEILQPESNSNEPPLTAAEAAKDADDSDAPATDAAGDAAAPGGGS